MKTHCENSWQALKSEKSAISKVKKNIICIFKNGKKSIFAPEKKFKTTKNAIFGLFSAIDFFVIFENENNFFFHF